MDRTAYFVQDADDFLQRKLIERQMRKSGASPASPIVGNSLTYPAVASYSARVESPLSTGSPSVTSSVTHSPTVKTLSFPSTTPPTVTNPCPPKANDVSIPVVAHSLSAQHATDNQSFSSNVVEIPLIITEVQTQSTNHVSSNIASTPKSYNTYDSPRPFSMDTSKPRMSTSSTDISPSPSARPVASSSLNTFLKCDHSLETC